jgi:rhamnosyltransferase subunit B
MHAILVPFGSSGDVYPFLGLGAELRRRGHRVTMISTGNFAELAQRAGFEFLPFMSAEQCFEIIRNPDLWHPRRSLPLLARSSVIPAIPVIYRLIEQLYQPGESAVIAGSLALGARVAQEKLGLHLTTVHLQPMIFRSRHEPPVLPGLAWLPRLPVLLRPAVFRLMDAVLDRLFAPPLNAFRAGLGLAPVSRVLDQWWHSPDATLALFPNWYAPPQPDWPAQLRCLDFPLYDAGALESPAGDLEACLADGPAPIVFTSGSAMATGSDFFAASARACELLGRRGLLVTKFPEQLPRTLPALVQHLDYAPFSHLLPRAAAFVHHGGIGTASQALRAGVPQLVAPLSYDQFDNATRLQRLGVSMTLPRARYRATNVVAMLQALLASAQVREHAARCAARFGAGDPLVATVDVIEQGWRVHAAGLNAAAVA